jgi:hypothetical protein
LPSENNEIEVTPAMIAAGDEILRERAYEFWESTTPEEEASLVAQIFIAMDCLT